jgi:flavin-dependent dehydrogenase
LLAEEGHDVLVLERAHFPRFHIGESLLPADLPLFERLGFQPGPMVSIPKAGADFLDERDGRFARYPFADGLDGTPESAFQVDRARFDRQLAETAVERGAELRYGVRVRRVHDTEDALRVETDAGDIFTRYLVDATGRERLLARQHRSYEAIDGLGKAAVFTHFDELSDAAVRELQETGNITILIVDRGWGWVIPLPGARLSVGFVSAEQGVATERWFEEQYAASPMLSRLTAGARRGETKRLGDYSYRNTRPYGARWGCVGDASYFLDPVFSSGVTLALLGAEGLAARLAPALRQGTEADPELLAPLEARMQHAFTVFGALIRRFYHTRIVDHLFFCDDPDPELRAGLISVLAADVFRDDNRFQQMLLRSPRKRPARSRQKAEAR